MNSEARLILGQLLAAGFDGPVIPPEFERLVRQYKVGNVILFKRNVESYEQLRALCGDLRALIEGETGHAPIIMAGEDGGSVSRIAHIAAQTPCPMAVGATGDPENARTVGRWIGKAMRAVGVNMDFGPVLDVFSNPDNAVIGTRSFGPDPETASAFGTAFLRGLREAGVMGCGKHFPGHGDTAVDSHLALPIVDKPMEMVRGTELVSFTAAIRHGIDAIMTAHVVFPAMEPERIPSTVSRRVMTGLLRQELGFGGILVSDGMEMNAVKELFGMEEGIRRALCAGVDIALVCHEPAKGQAAMERRLRAVDEGEWDTEETLASYRRVAAKKTSLAAPSGGP